MADSGSEAGADSAISKDTKSKIMSDFPAYKKQSVDALIPYARNSRTHSDAQIDKIAASIREFGFLNPVITDGDNGIVAGHGRVMAAKKIGMDEVPVVEAAHLTEAQKRAYVIADNRLALDAGWDDEMLRVEFAELEEAGFDLGLTGFEAEEIAGIASEPDFEPGTEEDQGKLDEIDPKLVDCPHCGKEFDLRERECSADRLGHLCLSQVCL